jgi:hypothetical protein
VNDPFHVPDIVENDEEEEIGYVLYIDDQNKDCIETKHEPEIENHPSLQENKIRNVVHDPDNAEIVTYFNTAISFNNSAHDDH